MKSAHKHLIATALLATLGLTAIAQTPPPANAAAGTPPAAGHRMGHGDRDPAKMKEYMAKRQAELKAQLALTPAQEGAWTAWTAAMQPPAGMKRPDPAEMQKLSTPERIDRMRAMRTERNAEMDKRADATKTFYAALTPEQKKVFDAKAMRHGDGHHGGHGMRHKG